MRTHFVVPALATALIAVPLTLGLPAASAGVLTAVPAAAPSSAKSKVAAKSKAKAPVKGKSAVRTKPTPKPPVEPKPAPAPFTVVGPVTAVDPAGSVTVAGLGGHKDLRSTPVTVLVTATTKVHLNAAPSSLSEVRVGFRVTVVGTRTGTTLT